MIQGNDAGCYSKKKLHRRRTIVTSVRVFLIAACYMFCRSRLALRKDSHISTSVFQVVGMVAREGNHQWHRSFVPNLHKNLCKIAPLHEFGYC